MRLSLDPRARAWLAALPRTSWFAVSELVLLAALAWAAARLFWAIVTPMTPLGDWRPPLVGAAGAVPLGSFDPFFRLADAGGPATVTALDIRLYGVRADQATGRGSAIVGLPDGTQTSVAVGEEVMPGVRLEAVRTDGVTILRGGAREQLYLDQSIPATTVAPGAPLPVVRVPPPAIAAPPPTGVVAPAQIGQAIDASPRIADGRVTGFTLNPRGDGQAFRAAGLQAGDVLVAVNGARMADAASIAALPDMLAAGGAATLEVERGGSRVVVTTRPGQ